MGETVTDFYKMQALFKCCFNEEWLKIIEEITVINTMYHL